MHFLKFSLHCVQTQCLNHFSRYALTYTSYCKPCLFSLQISWRPHFPTKLQRHAASSMSHSHSIEWTRELSATTTKTAINFESNTFQGLAERRGLCLPMHEDGPYNKLARTRMRCGPSIRDSRMVAASVV